MTDIRVLALALTLFSIAGCRGHGSPDGGVREDAVAAPVDTNVPPRDTGTRDFDPCIDDSDCPVGSLCSIPPTQPPRSDATAPLQCRPHCAHDSDCVVPLAGITFAVECSEDGFCAGRCANSPSVPHCMSPYECHVFVGYEDGYCVLPPP